MKNIILILTIIVLGVFLITSCSDSSGEKFIGKWKSEQGFRIDITRDGEVYILKFLDFSERYTFTFSDGMLKGSGIAGDITYGKENNHIYFAGKEYEKTN